MKVEKIGIEKFNPIRITLKTREEVISLYDLTYDISHKRDRTRELANILQKKIEQLEVI